MRVIDAFWEERNLGVTCYELELELSDCLESVEATLSGLTERQYMVAKIPSSRYDLVQLFQGKGYFFIETAIELEFNFKKLGYDSLDVPKGLQKICDRCSWGPMDARDLEQLHMEVHKNIFTTDRVFVDPAFTKKQAAQRYDFWIQDLVQQGSIPFRVALDGETFGFFVDKEIAPAVYHSVLGGVYTEHKGPGLGYVLYYADFMSRVERRMERSVTSVSGSNPASLRLQVGFGAEIKELTYVLVKHT